MDNSAEAGHIQEDLLDRYASGSLSTDLVPALEEHLLECAGCQSRLRDADEFAGLFTAATSGIEFHPAPWWQRVLPIRIEPIWVAALAMVVLAVPTVRHWNRAGQSPEAEILMESLRGPAETARIPAGKPARLIFDLASGSGSGNCTLRILDTNGAAIQETRTTPAGTRPAASIARLAPGDYWARLYCGTGAELTAEYSLNAK
jgi:hypothetical protein